MPTRNEFTAEQWQAVRNAPQLVALATAAAANSGLFGSLSEGMATASTIAATLRGEQPLLREIFADDQMRAAQDEIKSMLRSVGNGTALDATLQTAAMEAVTAALAALEAKGTDAEVTAFRDLLRQIGDKVANAAREGGFLGFGGQRISDGERQFLARLQPVIGGTGV